MPARPRNVSRVARLLSAASLVFLASAAAPAGARAQERRSRIGIEDRVRRDPQSQLVCGGELAESPACLKQRIDRLERIVIRLEEALRQSQPGAAAAPAPDAGALEDRLKFLEGTVDKIALALTDAGDRQGVDNTFKNIWIALDDLRRTLDSIRRRLPDEDR